MPIRRLMLPGLAALLLAACATTIPVYEPARDPDDYGYRDTMIEENRVRVSYRAKDAGTASDYALLRAADLTLARGFDWFEVVSSDTEQVNRRSSGSSVSIGGSTGSYGSGVGVGVGIGLGSGRSPGGSVRTIEVIMGSGAKPDSPNAYDARAVQSNIRARFSG